MNRSEIRQEARYILNDPNSISFGNVQLNDWIDLGNLDAQSRLEFDTAMATISTVASEPNYQLPENAMSLKEVFLQNDANDEQKLQVVDQEELTEKFGAFWRSSDPAIPLISFQADYNVLGVHPTPNTASAGKTLRVFYWRIASDLASDKDIPTYTKALHDALAWYCGWRGYVQKGNLQYAQYCRTTYDGMISRFYSVSTRFSDDMKRMRW